jgi:hypothetical protein
MVLQGKMVFPSTSMVTSVTLPALAERRSWVFEAFMERPMLLV